MEDLQIKTKDQLDAEQEKKPETEVKEEKNLSLIEQAQEASGTLRDLLGAYKKENDRLEQLRAATILGGKGESNQPAPKKKEMTDEEFADAAMRGELND